MILTLMPSGAAAQIELDFTPMLTELTLAPGATDRFEVVMSNKSKVATAEFSVFLMDVVQKPNGEYSVVELGKSGFSCASWIKLSVNRLKVTPGKAAALVANIAVPRSASGSRYAAIVFEMEPEPRKDTSALGSTAVVQRFVSIVEVVVPTRSLVRKLDIMGFSVSSTADKPVLANKYGASALVLSLEVKNPGTVHVFTDATMLLRDASGKRLREVPLGGGRGIVLPDTTISVTSILPAGLAPGDYIADIAVRYSGPRPAMAKVPFSVGDAGAGASELETVANIAPFSADPLEFDLAYPAGATVSRSVIVENRSTQTIRVSGRATGLDFDAEGQIVTDGAQSASSCAEWIKLSPEIVDIRPGSKKVVRATVAIPKDQAGGKYANLVFTATPAGASEGDAWSAETGTTVTLRVGKEFTLAGTLSPITVEDGGPSVGRVFGTVFTNTGNIHVSPDTSVSVSRRVMPEAIPGIEYIGRGSLESVAQLNLGEEFNPVLPGGTRELLVAMSGSLEPGDYVVEFVVQYGGEAPLYLVHEFTVN